MLRKFLKSKLIYMFGILLSFYLIPLLGRDTGSYIFILLKLIPGMIFSISLLYGYDVGFEIKYICFIILSFIPTIYIYYNLSALGYALFYAFIASIGMGLGSFLSKK